MAFRTSVSLYSLRILEWENQALLFHMVFVLFLVAIYAMHNIELIIVNDLSNETPTEEGLNNMW